MESQSLPVAPVADKPRLKFKWLRIAVSVFFLLLAVGFVGLWVRSYWTWDRCYWDGKNHGWQLNSMLGDVVLVVAEPTEEFIPFFIASLPTEGRFKGEFDKYFLGFYFGRTPSLELGVPFWFLVLISAILAYVICPPWHQLRFSYSLKALMLFTTLVAVLLGLGVWLVRG